MKYKIFIFFLLFFFARAHAALSDFFYKTPFLTKVTACFAFLKQKERAHPATTHNMYSPAGNRKTCVWPTPPPVFVNSTGNDCFANAAFTTLFFSNPVLSTYFSEARKAFNASEDSANKAIGVFLENACLNNKINPVPLLTAFAPSLGIRVGQQSDSFELVQKIIEKATDLKETPYSHGNPITQAFLFSREKSITCEGQCVKDTNQHKTEIISSIALPVSNSLSNSFEKYQNPDLLENSPCAHCNKSRYQQYRFTKLPQLLAIGLQRNNGEKRDDLPTQFKLENFQPLPQIKNAYNLTGLILHNGSVSNGHYIAIAQGNGESDTANFYLRNDSEQPLLIPKPCMRYFAEMGHLKKEENKNKPECMLRYEDFLPTAFIYLKHEEKAQLPILFDGERYL